MQGEIAYRGLLLPKIKNETSTKYSQGNRNCDSFFIEIDPILLPTLISAQNDPRWKEVVETPRGVRAPSLAE